MKQILKKFGQMRPSKKLLVGALMAALVIAALVPMLVLAQTAGADPAAGGTAPAATTTQPATGGSASADTSRNLENLLEPFITGESSEMFQKMVNFLVSFFEFLQTLLLPILFMIGALLKNDILYEAGMENAMLSIWTNIRNVVNILFVLVLLGIAFYNVVGGKQQDYHIKTMLPKFVIALIAVNFSFLMVKVAVDAVNVVTTAIFALPQSVQTDITPEKRDELARDFCPEWFRGDNYEELIQKEGDKSFCAGTKQNPEFTELANRFFSTYDSHNAAIVMAYNLGQLGKFDTVKETVKKQKDLWLNALFSLVFYIVYTIAFVALLIVLLARVVAVWVLAILSPLLFLQGVLPEKLKFLVMGTDSTMREQFIKTLTVPIPIAITMSVGFIMVTALKAANFSVNNSLSVSALSMGTQTSGLSTLQDLVAAFATVAFVWMGVFEAASGTLAGKVTDGLKTAAESAGKFLATAPIKYAPIFPITVGQDGEEEKVSLATMGGVLGGITRAPEIESQEKSREILKKMGFGGGGEFSDAMRGASNPTEAMQVLVNADEAGKLDGFLQEDLYQRIQSNPALWKGTDQNQFDLSEATLSRLSNGKYKDENAFMNDLKKGRIDSATFEKWMRENNRERFNRMTAQENPNKAPQADQTTPAPATGAATAAAAAGAVVALTNNKKEVGDKDFDSMKQNALSAESQAAVDKAITATGPDAEKLSQDPAVTKASQQMQDLVQMQQEFLQRLDAAMLQDTAAVDSTIISYREQLKEKVKENTGISDENQLDQRADIMINGTVTDLKNKLGASPGGTLENSQEIQRMQKAAQSAGAANPTPTPAANPAPPPTPPTSTPPTPTPPANPPPAAP